MNRSGIRRSARGALRLGPQFARVAALGSIALRRYLIQDVASTVGAIVGGCAAQALAGRPETLIAGAILGDNLGFYGVAWVRERALARRPGASVAPASTLRSILAEFGLAEAADLLLFRPAFLALAARSWTCAPLAIVTGGFAADLVFYAIAAASFRRRTLTRGRRRR